VYVCDGTRVLRPHATAELRGLALLDRPLVILTDPDERGRQLRGHLDGVLTPLLAARSPPGVLLHAFVPEASAISAVDGAVHAAGNRGIEHAVPGVLVTALRGAAPSHPAGRMVWDSARLQEMRLARAFNRGGRDKQERVEDEEEGGAGEGSSSASASGRSSGDGVGGRKGADEPRERRRRLCAMLGLGKCSGTQLAAALNKYFTEERVEAAVTALDG